MLLCLILLKKKSISIDVYELNIEKPYVGHFGNVFQDNQLQPLPFFFWYSTNWSKLSRCWKWRLDKCSSYLVNRNGIISLSLARK